MRSLTSMILLFALAACGTRGPLELPPGPAPEPLLGKIRRGEPAQTQLPDHSNNPINP